ncbi:MAG: hypothetical protein J3R72DRAFT_435976 [Linnemannia gamsii]|nr:MAG: hypothetical protein J3R72DRAFT_435976 [Linnemannia gamsii]
MRLPTECFLLIFEILAKDEDTRTLGTLLRVSKSIQAMALPFLYQEPLWVFSQDRKMELAHHDIEGRLQQFRGRSERQQRHQQPLRKHRRFARADAFSLIRMLLGCVVDKSVVMTDFIKIAYQLDDDDESQDHLATPVSELPPKAAAAAVALANSQTRTRTATKATKGRPRLTPPRTMLTGPPSIDYLAFMKHFRVNYYTQGDDNWQLDLRTFCANLEPDELANHQHAALFAEIMSLSYHRMSVVRRTHDILAMDLTWALCSERLEQLQSLTIHLEETDRYLAVVGRLPLLSRVGFEQGNDLHFARKTDAMKQDMWRGAISFVERHTKAFGTLREIDYPSCPPSVRVLLWRALPLVQDPQVIDATNWVRFHAQTDRTRLGRVITIQIPAASYYFLEEHIETLLQSDPYLHRCRALVRYEMPFLGSAVDSFEWAVKEKLDAGYTRQDPNTSSPLPLIMSSSHPESSRLGHPRVMIKHISTQVDSGVVDGWLEDVTFAFSQSLETLTVRDYVLSNSPGILGTQWNLPCLRKLELQRQLSDLKFDTGVLAHSPFLEELVLRDHSPMTIDFDWDTVVTQEPLRLPKLRVLRLKGTPAITFHPHSFLTGHGVKGHQDNISNNNDGDNGQDNDYPGMPDLHTLSLDVDECTNSSPAHALSQVATTPSLIHVWRREDCAADVLEGPTLPRVRAFLRDQSIWTWTWNLPKLTVLELRGRFGLFFDLGQMQRMPMLQILCLDISSRFLPPKVQARTLDLSELAVTRGQKSEEPGKGHGHGNCNGEGGNDNGDDDGDDDRQHLQLLTLPRLTHLHLQGPWTIDGQTLKVLFTEVMPNLVCISEHGCQGFDLREWMEATVHLPNLLSANMSKVETRELPLKVIQEYGLEAQGGGGSLGLEMLTVSDLRVVEPMELSILAHWWPVARRLNELSMRGVMEYVFAGIVFTRPRYGHGIGSSTI